MTDVFDDMLRRSIPEYEEMRRASAYFAARFARPDSAVVDLGCSRGEALSTVRDEVRAAGVTGVRYYGAEVSEPMLAAAASRFARDPDVEVERVDLRREFPSVPPGSASVVLAVLTLQFVPVNYRAGIVSAARRALRPGGALVVVEKVLGSSAEVDAAMVDAYHAMKRRNGYSAEEVTRKSMALEGVLVPLRASWNEEMLRSAGFFSVDCFWAWMNFRGWVAVV